MGAETSLIEGRVSVKRVVRFKAAT